MNTDRFKYRAYFTDEYPDEAMRGKLVYCDGLNYDGCVDGAGYGNVVMMMCTGLSTGLRCKDQLIYEGDITQTVANDGSKLSIFIVYWHQSGAKFMKLREDGEQYEIDHISESHKVVLGNIFQNPELAPSPHHQRFISQFV